MQQLGGYFINVRNMHNWYMKFDYVFISLARVNYGRGNSVSNNLRPSNNSRQLLFNINAAVLIVIIC